MKTYTALEIARHVGVTKKAVKLRMGEPSCMEDGAGRYDMAALPAEWREAIQLRESYHLSADAVPVTFAAAKSARTKLQAAVLHSAFTHAEEAAARGEPLDQVLENLLRAATVEMQRKFPGWKMHMRSFERWHDRWIRGGKTLSSVTMQKQGRCGRKPLAALLATAQISAARAACNEYGGMVAPAARLLLSDPELPAELKERLVARPSSKSYVAPSIRKALWVPRLLVSRHHGAKQARIDGAYTIRDWDQVAAGEVWQSDDLTLPVYWWVEHNREPGFIIMQGQWLPMVDLGSQKILSHILIARETRQYTADDIWALVGKTIRAWGVPTFGFYFERGAWEASRLKGVRTGIEVYEREGALADLGCRVKHATTPNGKVIEGLFEHLQREMQRLPGYRGRLAVLEKFEKLEADVAACRRKQCHPRDIGLLHISQMSAELSRVGAAWNQARNDGKTCKGLCPDDVWGNKLPDGGLRALPDQAAFMLYANMSIVKVTRNGVRVQCGNQPLCWDNPQVLTRLQGREVMVWYTPGETEVATVTTRDRQFICHVKQLRQLHPLHATKEDLAEEGKRKNERQSLIRREYKDLSTFMPSNRGHVIPCDDRTGELNQRIQEARQQVEQRRQAVRSKVEERTKRAGNLARFLSDEPPSAESAATSGRFENEDGVPASTSTPRFEHEEPPIKENSCPTPGQQKPPL